MLWHAVDMLRCSVVPAHARAPVATAPACVASRRARGCRAAQQARRRGARQQTGSPPRGCHPGRPRPSPHMLTCCVAVLYARPAKAQAGIQAGRNSLLGFCRTHLFAPTLPLLRSTAAASAARGAAAAGAAEEGARGLTCWKARVEASLGSPTPSARCLSTCPPPPPPVLVLPSCAPAFTSFAAAASSRRTYSVSDSSPGSGRSHRGSHPTCELHHVSACAETKARREGRAHGRGLREPGGVESRSLSACEYCTTCRPAVRIRLRDGRAGRAVGHGMQRTTRKPTVC